MITHVKTHATNSFDGLICMEHQICQWFQPFFALACTILSKQHFVPAVQKKSQLKNNDIVNYYTSMLCVTNKESTVVDSETMFAQGVSWQRYECTRNHTAHGVVVIVETVEHTIADEIEKVSQRQIFYGDQIKCFISVNTN